jgi:3-oxoacyl-[acyl-carrier-protein] synthase-3
VTSRIAAIATWLPERVLSNADLERENPDWNMPSVSDKAGVIERHVAAPGETAFDLAKSACGKLAKTRKLDDVDAIVFCTQSPDYIMPSNAHLLHAHLGLGDAVAAFDINLACSGYVYGLALAHSMIAAGLSRRVLLATADTYSKYIHPKDRSARVLFGDGAAVSLIEASADPAGLSSFELASHGKQYDKFFIPAGGHRIPKSAATAVETTDRTGNVRSPEHIRMDGLGVWSFINSAAPRQIRSHLEKNRLSLDDIDLFVFHQASQMTLDSLIKALGIDRRNVYFKLHDVGNLVSASIPVCLAAALQEGRVQKGQRVLLCGFGVGLSYATTSFVYDGNIDVY